MAGTESLVLDPSRAAMLPSPQTSLYAALGHWERKLLAECPYLQGKKRSQILWKLFFKIGTEFLIKEERGTPFR